MARKPRFLLPGVPQHVIQRGNNREPCFYADTLLGPRPPSGYNLTILTRIGERHGQVAGAGGEGPV